jgi:hypothetical protein
MRNEGAIGFFMSICDTYFQSYETFFDSIGEFGRFVGCRMFFLNACSAYGYIHSRHSTAGNATSTGSNDYGDDGG